MVLKRSRSQSDLAEALSNSSGHKRAKRVPPVDHTLPTYKISGELKVNSPIPDHSGVVQRQQGGLRDTHKRSAESCGCEGPEKKKRQHRRLAESAPLSVSSWVSGLPESPQEFENMPRAPLKRTRSASDASDRSVTSDTETESAVSGLTKNSIYRNPRYAMVMESKGSYMRQSDSGPLPSEQELYDELQKEVTQPPDDPLFEPQRLQKLRALLQERSELRICIDLHSRLVPSAEILSLLYPNKFENLVEGHNDQWSDAIVFYEKKPQPDRTVAYRPSAFTDTERRKLGITPGVASIFTTREGMMFPFFTSEVKCGKEALMVADHANINSMTIALRAVVALYRQAGKVMEIHRKTLGFSISHDDGIVRIYGHYPEIDRDRTNYFRVPIREFSYADKNGQDRWTSYTFVWNLYTQFAPSHLKLIKEAINHLPDPLLVFQVTSSGTISNPQSTSDPEAVPSTPATSNADAQFAKPAPRRQQTVASLAKQLEQQREDFMAQLEEQKREKEESRAREQKVLSQLEKLQEQNASLMKLLTNKMMPTTDDGAGK